MKFDNNELIGILASTLCLISMCFNQSTLLGSLLLRVLNLLGSIIFVIYGTRINSLSLLFLNSILSFVNLYYTIRIIQKIKKQN